MRPELITGPWNLSDLANGKLGSPKNGLKVFSCFHCGGGSTMGYKLAGYTMMGGVEIDPEMMKLYRKNHNPKHSFMMGVQNFKKIPNEKLHPDLLQLDILDGSPPCSSFSLAGSREDAWGTHKKFREGQVEQVLDDLFFHFIDIAKKLQPKVVVAENVKGLIVGKAKGYVKEIFESFNEAGYDTQLFLLNASRMGVPQARERTFFIARRKDLKLEPIELNFEEPVIACEEAIRHLPFQEGDVLSTETKRLWSLTKQGDSLSKVHARGSRFNAIKLNCKNAAPTITSSGETFHWTLPRHITGDEVIALQSFPTDYNFMGVKPKYVCGMSVPPLMMQRVATEIARQFFKDEK